MLNLHAGSGEQAGRMGQKTLKHRAVILLKFKKCFSFASGEERTREVLQIRPLLSLFLAGCKSQGTCKEDSLVVKSLGFVVRVLE